MQAPGSSGGTILTVASAGGKLAGGCKDKVMHTRATTSKHCAFVAALAGSDRAWACGGSVVHIGSTWHCARKSFRHEVGRLDPGIGWGWDRMAARVHSSFLVHERCNP